jgi:putative acetyltransferase
VGAETVAVLIRRETSGDIDAIRAITAAAFATPEQPDPVEAPLVDALRADKGWLPALSLVAAGPAGEVVGHVVCTRGHVDEVPVVALGPLSVHPDHQGRGVGLALVHTVLGAADALGEPLVALLGHLDYYPRFGFRRSTEFGIDPPDPSWDAHFQVRPLSAYDPSIRGTFRYASAFEGL